MKRHATKIVFIVIITFGVCWFPQNMRFFLRGLNYPNLSFWEESTDLLLYVQTSAQVIAYANSCINPILYGALSERFRNGMWMAYKRFICRESNLYAGNIYNQYSKNSTSYFLTSPQQNQKKVSNDKTCKEMTKKIKRKKLSYLRHYKKTSSNSTQFSDMTSLSLKNGQLKRCGKN